MESSTAQPKLNDKASPPPPTTTTTTEATNKKGKKEKKQPPPGIVIPPKKPKLTKAERRAQQEAQRAAKAAGGGGKGKGGGKGGGGGSSGQAAGGSSSSAGKSKSTSDASSTGNKNGGDSSSGSSGSSKTGAQGQGLSHDDKTLNLFSHLPAYQDRKKFEQEFSGIKLGNADTSSPTSTTTSTLHPAILSLGHQYATGTIRGANARCKAMLRTFQILISDYTYTNNNNNSNNKSKQKDLRQDIESTILKPAFTYWTVHCRPHSVTMGNAFTFLKLAVANLDRDVGADEAKEFLVETIETYVQERIEFASRAISKYAGTKIVDGDVILTYAKSEVIGYLLEDAAREDESGGGGGGGKGKKKKRRKDFRLIIVDSRPLLEGGSFLRDFMKKTDIECTYVLLNSLSYVMMKEVTKVFLGAAALMSNGSVLSRVGTASIAMMAKANNVPVLVCCETYKISNRVQLESITWNEMGDPEGLTSTHCALDQTGGGATNDYNDEDDNTSGSGGDDVVLKDWRETQNLKLLNVLYDLTPSEFVSGIVNEMGILPPTSVAVLLREMNPQDNDSAFKSDDFTFQ